MQGASNEAKISGIEVFPTPTLPPLKFTFISATNGAVTLNWQTYAGKSYRLQYKSDLNATNWQNLTPDILAIGSSTPTSCCSVIPDVSVSPIHALVNREEAVSAQSVDDPVLRRDDDAAPGDGGGGRDP